MSVSAFATGTQTATISTEHTLSGVNVAGRYQLVIDLSNMASGDVLELRVYQTVLTGGTNRKELLYSFYGAQDADTLIFSSDISNNDLTDTNSLKYTLLQTLGTGRSYAWKVLQVDTDVHPTNFALLSIDANGRVDVAKIAGTSQTARDIGASVLLSSGTGTGQLDFTSGVVKANLAQILGTLLTETAGQLAAGFKQFFNIASPTSTMNTITAVTTATNLTTNNDKTGYSLAASQIVVKKNVALSNFSFVMIDSADHITPKTGLTVTAQRSIDGGAFAACTNAVTELSNGFYLINLSAADLNGNVISLKFTATGADQRSLSILTQA